MDKGNEATFDTYSVAIQKTVAAVAEEFKRSPESFLYEKDLQSLLFAKLYDALAPSAIEWPVRASDWMVLSGETPRRIVPVKTEYPSGTLLDIALLDPGFSTDAPRKIWSQQVLVGIEIKLWQADNSGDLHHEDQEKLKRLVEAARLEMREMAGACLVFCHRPEDERARNAKNAGAQVDPKRFTLKRNDVVEWIVTSAWAP